MNKFLLSRGGSKSAKKMGMEGLKKIGLKSIDCHFLFCFQKASETVKF